MSTQATIMCRTARPLRRSALTAFGVVVGVVVVLIATRSEIDGLANLDALTRSVRSLRLLGTVLIAVPALLGAFWGAPLVARELETGTHRLVWTQGVPRSRWLLTRLGIVAVTAAAVTALFSIAFTWWSGPLDAFGNRIGTANFGQRGIAPISYTVFAVALGAFLGAALRRTLPAMATTLVAFVAVRFAFQEFIRTHLVGTDQLSLPTNYFGTRPSGNSGGWVLSTRVVDGHGLSRAHVDELVRGACTITRATTPKALTQCADKAGVRDLVTMHPASQFWRMQALEAACFVALAVALAVATVWWVRRRLA